jgi:hypothetical protein
MTRLTHDPFIVPLRDNGFLIELIAEITSKDRLEVTRRFNEEH